jgi:GT2 family glycosyltransferase
MDLAPIVLFVYNRPQHARKTLEALALNKLADRSVLYIFSDGPKEDAGSEIVSNIIEVRKVIHEKNWCGKVYIIESGLNKGLVSSIIEGVTEIVNKHGRVIVLEDDLITSPFFLTYMNDALLTYRDFGNVYSVNGYMFPVETDKTESVLLPYISSWGWGTWKEKWAVFDIKMPFKDLIKENMFLKSRFNLGDYPFASMLDYEESSWAICWYYSVFIRNGLGVFPTASLIYNTGFDGSGIHFSEKVNVVQVLTKQDIVLKTGNSIDLDFFGKYLELFKMKKTSFSLRVYNRIIRTIRRRLT